MRKTEFQRTAPESVGISAKSILELLDRLEEDYSEIHSLMVMRYDQIIVEGWWQPYSPAVRHMMMSASKTFSGTAVGIAVKEGITTLLKSIRNRLNKGNGDSIHVVIRERE